jgi:hypothetical protein
MRSPNITTKRQKSRLLPRAESGASADFRVGMADANKTSGAEE